MDQPVGNSTSHVMPNKIEEAERSQEGCKTEEQPSRCVSEREQERGRDACNALQSPCRQLRSVISDPTWSDRAELMSQSRGSEEEEQEEDDDEGGGW